MKFALGLKPSRIVIEGASFGVIILEGSIEGELAPHGDLAFLHFNDGTVIEAEYTPGSDCWRIEAVKKGTAAYERKPRALGYQSDVVTLIGPISAVRLSLSSSSIDRAEMIEQLEYSVKWGEYSDEVLIQVIETLAKDDSMQ